MSGRGLPQQHSETTANGFAVAMHTRLATLAPESRIFRSANRIPAYRILNGENYVSGPRLPNANVTQAEWQARCELAALYHIANHLGWTDLINTHMSARVPDEPDTFLINSYGEMFDEITASSLVKMDFAGNVVAGAGKVNSAGFTIHSGVYKARPDASCVTHTHTRAGAGVSLLKHGLRPISQDALSILDEVAYHPYGVPATSDECEALGRTCQQGAASYC